MVTGYTKRLMLLKPTLSSTGIQFTELSPVDAQCVEERWLQAFAARVKREKGTPIYMGFKWHGFSYGIEPAKSGEAALSAYQSQWAAPFYVFDEKLNYCLKCEGQPFPELSKLRVDLYVVHHNMKWTMVFTHEQPDLGPYFATKKGV